MKKQVTIAPCSGPLDPQRIYAPLEEAMHAASCLSGLHESGAEIYMRVTPDNDEEYMIVLHPSVCQRTSGKAWKLAGDGWRGCYRIQRMAEEQA